MHETGARDFSKCINSCERHSYHTMEIFISTQRWVKTEQPKKVHASMVTCKCTHKYDKKNHELEQKKIHENINQSSPLFFLLGIINESTLV